MNQAMPPRHYFVFAGESSGDLHGGSLLKALKKQNPSIKLTGVGGPKMREQGIECLLPMEAFQVMGFTDVIAALPTLYKQFYQVRDAILSSKPDCVILIDYPGFNLRMAKALRRKNFPGKIVQMISPTVWAWGKGRIDSMACTLDLLLTIYPFEKTCFSETPLRVEYIGHPLVESIESYHYQDLWREQIGIPSDRPLIALFPGSREGEIQRNLPIHLEAAALFKKAHPDAIFALSCIDEKQESFLKTLLNQSSLNLETAVQDDKVMQDFELESLPMGVDHSQTVKATPIGSDYSSKDCVTLSSSTAVSRLKNSSDVYFVPRAFTYELMRDSWSAIAKSGTVTLELALHNRPTVVIYRLSALNRFIAQYVMGLRLPHYCIVNILANATIFPEWIEIPATPEALFHDLDSLNSEGSSRSLCLEGCAHVRKILGSFDTSHLAAKHIEGLFLS